MNKFFDVGNAHHCGCFISAKDKKDAVKVALALGHIKKASSADVGEPLDMSQDSSYNSLHQILKSGKRGRLIKRVSVLSIGQLPFPGVSDPGGWMLCQEV